MVGLMEGVHVTSFLDPIARIWNHDSILSITAKSKKKKGLLKGKKRNKK